MFVAVVLCYVGNGEKDHKRIMETLCLCFNLFLQSHQNEVEIFDENLAHISTWLYQTQIHLDEAERLAPAEKEKVVQVRES